MSLINEIKFAGDQATLDAGGRIRVSQLTTLGDLKILGTDDNELWDTAGNGSGTYSENKYEMSVQAGQYKVRQTTRFFPYFSGKSQICEFTMDKFQLEAGLVKRFGYFSSQATGTYDAQKDGWWVEGNGLSGTYYIVTSYEGTETSRQDWRTWDNYSGVSGTSWANFNVHLIDFLWLGGAVLRHFVKVGSGFLLVNQIDYAGSAQNTFIKSPNQPLRYEIRSVSGAGTFRYICAQISTEGSINESSKPYVIDTGTAALSLATVGTRYVVKAIRKKSELKQVAAQIESAQALITSINDYVRWSLELNPTIAGGSLVWSDNVDGVTQEATGDGTLYVSGTSRTLASGYLAQGTSIDPSVFENNFLSWLGGKIDGTQSQFVFCVTPLTATVATYGSISYRKY